MDEIEALEKKYGSGSVYVWGKRKNVVEKVDAISTGSLGLDHAIGIGGIPRGRIIEIFGPESVGKTTLALHIIAEAQKAGGKAAFVDVEHALDMEYTGNIGANIDDLIFSQPDSAEQALGILEDLIRTSGAWVVVVDSVAALIPQAEIDGDIGQSQMGLQARLMSQTMRKIKGITRKTNTSVVFINQLRDKIGVTWGARETTTGGRALKFYASVRIDLRKITTVQNGTDATGITVKAKIVKNKVAPPFKTCEYNILWGKGISIEDEIIEFAVSAGLIEKAGSWYTIDGEKMQGTTSVRKKLLELPDYKKELLNKIRTLWKS